MSNIIIPKMFGQQLNLGHWSTNGLVFYFRGIQAVDAIDESLYKNHGELKGDGLTWQGDSLHFAGSDDYVDLGRQPVDFTKDHTVIARVKTEDVSAWHQIMSSGANQQFAFGTNDLYWVSTGGNYVVASNVLFVDVWCTAAFTYKATTTFVVLYLDGVIVASGTKTSNVSVSDTNIGANVAGTGEEWLGNIADIKVYNRTLSASEIAELTINPDLLMQQEPAWRGKTLIEVGANPKGPLGHPLYGPFAGPIGV